MQIKLSSTKRKEHLVHRLKHVIELAPESPPSKTTRSLDLSRVRRNFQEMSGRQTDKRFFFKKIFETAVYYFKLLLHYLETFKTR